MATVQQLTAEGDALTEEVRQMKNLLALFMTNGLADAFDGTGNQRFGSAGGYRLGNSGMEILAPTLGATKVGVWYVPTLQPTQPGSNTNYAVLEGNGNVSDNFIRLKALRSDGDYAQVTAYSDGSNNFARIQTRKSGAASAEMGVSSQDAQPYSYAVNGPFWWPVAASDYSFSADGQVQYRTDTDRFRGFANAITRNFTMDGTGTTLTIATGAVTITTSFHAIDTESAAASDDLDTISGGQTGQVLYLHAANGARDVVFKDGTGNLKLAGDFTANSTEDMIAMINDGTNWLELCRSDNGA